MGRILAAAVVASALLAVPGGAVAAVLVNQGPRSLACGQRIQMGVWYQSFSGGARWAVLTVASGRGTKLYARRVRATTTWRYYRYSPRCGHSYRVAYRVPGGQVAYTVRVRRHRAGR
jgi:hypothetical protein